MQFLDLDQLPGVRGRKLQRPWTKYWPPQKGSPVHNWFQSEFPAILTYRFDPEKPFDRPFKAWTKEAREMGKDLAVDLLPTQVQTSSDLTEADSTLEVSEEDKQQEVERQRRTRHIDKVIEDLRLPALEVKGFNYLLWSPRYRYEKPFHSRLPILDCLKQNNIQSQAYAVTIHDVAGLEHQFNLANSGFQFLKCATDIQDWTDTSIRTKYLPSMKNWLQTYFNCEEAHIYTYNVRSKVSKGNLTTSWVPTVPFAHCDVTPSAISTHLKLYLPDKKAEIEKKRHRFVNIWRPITGPYQDAPLAVCDYRSVNAGDLVAADAVLAHYCGEAYDVKHSPHHRWFYKRRMSTDDVILFKLFDSDSSEATRGCPVSRFGAVAY